ncbi:MAG: hypothetical protein J6584_01725 [Lactobacillus sp.]|uniref:hypothetical protein n=1 Tax=Bombilactobacillus bombi TaxID=1303590 RepID=UPI0035E75991|nr:hypothetical protein [Lactobacillus sp.]
MIFYMQFNAANIPGVIEVTNVKQEQLYYLIRTQPHWKTSYNLLGISQDVIGQIKQISSSNWPNFKITIGSQAITNVYHVSNSRHQLMIAPSLHWIIKGNLFENNYIVHNFHHKLIMTVDNIYFKNGHEGYLLNIEDTAEPKIGILLAAVLNQTSRNTKNKRSIERLKGQQMKVSLKRNIDMHLNKR